VTTDDRALAVLLARPDLPPGFERWQVVLEPGDERATEPAEWAGALVLVERGLVEAVCRAGGHRTFRAGDLVALGWLPLRLLRNPATEVASIVAVRRRGKPPSRDYLRIVRFRPSRVG
jgi:hypothetical protein